MAELNVLLHWCRMRKPPLSAGAAMSLRPALLTTLGKSHSSAVVSGAAKVLGALCRADHAASAATGAPGALSTEISAQVGERLREDAAWRAKHCGLLLAYQMEQAGGAGAHAARIASLAAALPSLPGSS